MVDSPALEPFELLDHLPVGALVLARDHTVVFWNLQLEEWTGVPRDQIVGTCITQRFPNLGRPIYQARLQGVFSGGAPVIFSAQLHQYVIPIALPDGQFRTQHTTVTALASPVADEFYALLVIEDVTDMTRRLQEYRGLRDQALAQARERQRAEEAEHEQRVLAEAFRDIAAALNGTLELNQLLDEILKHIGRVMRYEMVNLMLLEGDTVRVVRSQSPTTTGNDAVLGLRIRIADLPNLRQMLELGVPCVIPDTAMDADWVDLPVTRWIRSYAGVPIVTRQQTIGFLTLTSGTPNFFSQPQAERLKTFADQAATAIENARLYAQVQQLAITDGLTNLLNRRGLFQVGTSEFERTKRFQHPLTAILLDIDHFKSINDTYGHAAGDLVLVALADCCRYNIRAVDIAGRYGGEEFVLLLPETTLPCGLQAAERLRAAIEAMRVPTAQGAISITISLGVAPFTEQTNDLAELIQQADRAHYRAKQAGRNRVVPST